MRAAANKPNVNIVAVNDPFISVDYSKYLNYMINYAYILFLILLKLQKQTNNNKQWNTCTNMIPYTDDVDKPYHTIRMLKQ